MRRPASPRRVPRSGSGEPGARLRLLLAVLTGLAALATLAPGVGRAAPNQVDQVDQVDRAGRADQTDRSAPDGIDLHVQISPQTVTVGDRITAVLTLTVPAEQAGQLAGEPRFPTWGDHWGKAEVLEAGPVEPRTEAGAGRGSGQGPGNEQSPAGSSTWSQRLVLAAFQPGTFALPKVTVRVPLLGKGVGGGGRTVQVTTDAPLPVKVRSVLPLGTDAASLQPTTAAPPRPLPAGAPFWWTLAGGVLLAGAFVLLGSARRRRRGSTGLASHRPPFEELIARLDELAAASPGAPEPGHVALSLALRRYLGRRLDFPATESTTTEVRRRLRDRRLPDPVIEPAALVLERCDAVKFAQAPVAPGAFGASIAAARELARTLEGHLAPVTLTPVDSGMEGRNGGDRRGAAA